MLCSMFFSYCRRYVERELSFEIGHLPEKHDLSYYPTIHDLQNHIHKALQEIRDGTLPFSGSAVSVSSSHGSHGSRKVLENQCDIGKSWKVTLWSLKIMVHNSQ